MTKNILLMNIAEQYPNINSLEVGNIIDWLQARQFQLLQKSKEERKNVNIAKTINITVLAIGSLLYASSPLAPIGAVLGASGYIWSVVEDYNLSHSFAPLPFVRDDIFSFFSAMGDKDSREEYLARKSEILDLIKHLDPLERAEFVLVREFLPSVCELLSAVEDGNRFVAYKWILDNFTTKRGKIPTTSELNTYKMVVKSKKILPTPNS
jgi:hypothetical protein